MNGSSTIGTHAYRGSLQCGNEFLDRAQALLEIDHLRDAELVDQALHAREVIAVADDPQFQLRKLVLHKTGRSDRHVQTVPRAHHPVIDESELGRRRRSVAPAEHVGSGRFITIVNLAAEFPCATSASRCGW